MKIDRILISLLLWVGTLFAEKMVDIDTFLQSLEVPSQKEILCKDFVKDNTEYMQCLEEKTANDPSIENINFLAGVYAVKRDYDKALGMYQKSVKQGDQKAIYFTAGIYNEALKTPDTALPYFKNIKNFKDSTCQIGGIYAIVKDESSFEFMNKSKAKSKTLDFYDDEIEKGNMKAYGCKALYYMSLQEYDDAEDVIEEGMKKDDITSVFLMGQLRDEYGDAQSGERDELYKYYKLAAKMGYQKAAHNLGVTYAQRHKWHEAEFYFRREVELGKEDALSDLAHVYAERKEYETAEKTYRKLVEFGNYDGLYQAGLMYAESGNKKYYKKAEEIYQECIDENYSDCASGIGSYYVRQKKDYDKGISYYKLGNKMGNALSTFNLGVIYSHELNNKVKAIQWYEKAVEMGNSNAAFNIGHIYEFDIKDYPKAIKWYKKSTAMGGRNHIGRIQAVERRIKHQKGKQ